MFRSHHRRGCRGWHVRPRQFFCRLSSHERRARLRPAIGRPLYIERLEERQVLSGVTVITHGFFPVGVPDWAVSMGEAILDRADGDSTSRSTGTLLVHDTSDSVWKSPESVSAWDDSSDDPWKSTFGIGEEIVLIYDWTSESNDPDNGWLEAAADNLFATLMQPLPNNAGQYGDLAGMNMFQLADLDMDEALDFHFIGHSRGAVLNTLVTQRFASYFPNYTIDQVTSLDPHPADSLSYDDPWHNTRVMPTLTNVDFADNYYRADLLYELDGDFNGIPASGSVSTDLSARLDRGLGLRDFQDGIPFDPTGLTCRVAIPPDSIVAIPPDSNGYCTEHSDTHLWYHGTIAPETPLSDGGATISSQTREDWYTDNKGENEGYVLSRIAGRNGREAVPGKIAVGEDLEFPTLSTVFNGSFRYQSLFGDQIPGWERHGGVSDAVVESGAARLGYEFLGSAKLPTYSRLTHNPLFIPASGEALVFDYRVTGTSNSDKLKVYIGDQLLETIDLTNTTDRTAVTVGGLPFIESPGRVDTIEFRLEPHADPNTNVYIDNVGFTFPQRLDLIFVIDTTGSMEDDIEAVEVAAIEIVDNIADSIPDYRIAVVAYRDFDVEPYGDSGDYTFRDVQAFTRDKNVAVAAIRSLSDMVGGGGDTPESVYSALMHSIDASSLGAWRGQPVKKSIILMGDAPPHDPEPFTGYTLKDVVQAAEDADPVIAYPVATNDDAEPKFAELAEGTGGMLFVAESPDTIAIAVQEAITTSVLAPFPEAGGPYEGSLGSPILFDAFGSYDPDGEIVLYEWDWDSDGVYDDSSVDPTAEHVWTAPFEGTIRMRVTDDEGLTAFDTALVVAGPGPVVAAGEDQLATEGANVELSAAFEDDLPAGPYTATINWGDGTESHGLVDEVDGVGAVAAEHTYADDGVYTATLTVTASDSRVGSDVLTITVENVEPDLWVRGRREFNEGEEFTVEDIGLFSDPGFGDTETFSGIIDWGDGMPSDLSAGMIVIEGGLGRLTRGTFDGSHTYVDEGTDGTGTGRFYVHLRVKDDDEGYSDRQGGYSDRHDGFSDWHEMTVVVNNLPPSNLVLDILNSGDMAFEGEVATLMGTFVDPGILDEHTITVDWGDGTSSTFPPGTAPGLVPGEREFTLTHTYRDDGPNPGGTNPPSEMFDYAITVGIDDGDGGSISSSTTVTVKNVDPTLSPPGPQSADEGELLNLVVGAFTDAGELDVHTAQIDWGDGSTPDAGIVDQNAHTIAGSHVYSDDGVYGVEVTVIDDDGGQAMQTFQVTIGNVNPTLVDSVVDRTLDEGDLLSIGPVTFNDLGTRDTHTVTIDWGDGHVDEDMPVSETPFGPPGSVNGMTGTFSAAHYYADNRNGGVPYTVTVTLKDDDGGQDQLTFQAAVLNVDPVLTTPSGAFMVDEGLELSIIDIGMFSDPGFDNPSDPFHQPDGSRETFSYRIDWGDGTDPVTRSVPTLDVAGSPGVATQGSFDASHIYADDGTYTVTVSVFDDDGGDDTKSFEIVVKNVDPTLTLNLPAATSLNLDEGTLLDLPELGMLTDPAFADSDLGNVKAFTYRIAWGDGIVDEGPVTNIQQGSRGTPTRGTFDASHTYADNGTFVVTVFVTDDDGGADSEIFQVTVSNVAPSLFLAGNQTARVAESLDIMDIALLMDPGFDNPLNSGGETQETFEYAIDWNDGTLLDTGTVTIDVAGQPGVMTTGTFDASHVYNAMPPSGTYLVTVTVTDDDSGSATESFEVVVSEALNAEAEGQETSRALDIYGPLLPWEYPNASNTVSMNGGLALSSNKTSALVYGPLPPHLFSYVEVSPPRSAIIPGEAEDVCRVETGSMNDQSPLAEGSSSAAGLIYGPLPAPQPLTLDSLLPEGEAGNARLLLTVVGNQTVDEGQLTIPDIGTFIADDSTGPIQFQINWGDGSTPEPFENADIDSIDASHARIAGSFDGNHKYSSRDVPYIVAATLSDNDGNSITESFEITVNNVAPSVAPNAATIVVDEGETAENTGTYFDPSDPVELNASKGTIVDNHDGTWSWSFQTTDGPDESETVTITASDGEEPPGTKPSETTFELVVKNLPPEGAPDEIEVVEGGTATVLNGGATSVLHNDTDVVADPITAVHETGPSFASSFTLNADGTFSYSHDDSERFSDSFTYHPDDGIDPGDTVTVSINVTAVNDNPPVANPDEIEVDEGGTATILVRGATSVLANDTDQDIPRDTLTVDMTPVRDPAHGSLSLNEDGTFRYTHNGMEEFSDSFEYRVRDAADHPDTTTVNVKVNSVNDAPVLSVPSQQATDLDAPLVFSNANNNEVTVADEDVEGNRLLVTLNVTNGTLSLGGTDDLAFMDGDGIDDTRMTFEGVLAAVNAAFNGATFEPQAGFAGTGSIEIMVDDQGSTGIGDGRTTETINISIGRNSVISGFVFADLDADERFDLGSEDSLIEDGLPLTTVTLLDAERKVVKDEFGEELVIQTNADGSYRFNSLFSGTYIVSITRPCAIMADDRPTEIIVTVGAGEEVTNANIGSGGLQPQYVSPQLFLASNSPGTEARRELLRRIIDHCEAADVVLAAEGMWLDRS